VRFKAMLTHLALNLFNSTATPVLDKGGRVIAILAGRPKSATEASWHALHNEALQAMVRGQEQASFTAKQSSHRRGEFSALSTGASFGGGQRVRLCSAIIGCSLRMTGPWKPSEHQEKHCRHSSVDEGSCRQTNCWLWKQ
jgi:hypothetical protein